MRVKFIYAPRSGSKVFVEPQYWGGIYAVKWSNGSHHIIGDWVDVGIRATATKRGWIRPAACNFFGALATAVGGVAWDIRGYVGMTVHLHHFPALWPYLLEFADKYDDSCKFRWMNEFLELGGYASEIFIHSDSGYEYRQGLLNPASIRHDKKLPHPSELEACYFYIEDGYYKIAGLKLAPESWKPEIFIGATLLKEERRVEAEEKAVEEEAVS